jgi:prepilin-type N-terminal cleavage/methylation domain-containing protein
MKKILKKNKGFSLLELLIVITVSLILVGGAVIGINLVHNANVNSAAERLESAFNSARSISMAKGQNAGAITFRVVGESVYAYIGDPEYGRGDTVTTSEMELICTGALTAHADVDIGASGNPDITGINVDDPTDIADKFTLCFNSAGEMFKYNDGGTLQEYKDISALKFTFRKGLTGKRVAMMYIRPMTGYTDVVLFALP